MFTYTTAHACAVENTRGEIKHTSQVGEFMEIHELKFVGHEAHFTLTHNTGE